MRNKILLFFLIVVSFVCLLAVSVGATTVYVDENGTELFSCEIADGHHIDSYQILNGGFAKVDSEGNALTWYLVEQTTDGTNIKKVVKAVKTADVYENGAYTNGVDKKLVVSANFEVGTDTVPEYGAFSGSYNKELLFIYVPDAVKTIPYRFCQNVPVVVCEFSENSELESWGGLAFYGARSIRSLFIPKNFTRFPNDKDGELTGCTRLEELTFHKESTLETLPSWKFGNTKIKRLIVPDSVTYLNSRAFQGMQYLEYVDMGKNVTHIYKNENNHSMFHDCSRLKTVVFPPKLTAENLIDNYGGGFDYFFSSGSPTFVITGSLDEFLKVKDVICTASNNSGLKNATVENGRIVVAGYCETYYGAHSWLGQNTAILDSYFAEIGVGDVCGNCGLSEVKDTISPLFACKGISAKTFGDDIALIQGYDINREAITEYKKYVADFDFGILAYANKDGAACQPKPGDDMVIDIVFDNMANDYVEVKLTGVPEDNRDVALIFCIYATEGESFYYLDDGVMAESVVGKSYNNIVG